MLFSLSPDSKLHTRDDEKRDRERDGVVWGETIFCSYPPLSPKLKLIGGILQICHSNGLLIIRHTPGSPLRCNGWCEISFQNVQQLAIWPIVLGLYTLISALHFPGVAASPTQHPTNHNPHDTVVLITTDKTL